MKSTDALNTAVQGLFRAQERLATSAEKVANGDVSAESLIDTKLSTNDVKAQLKAVSIISDTEKKLLDEIA